MFLGRVPDKVRPFDFPLWPIALSEIDLTRAHRAEDIHPKAQCLSLSISAHGLTAPQVLSSPWIAHLRRRCYASHFDRGCDPESRLACDGKARSSSVSSQRAQPTRSALSPKTRRLVLVVGLSCLRNFTVPGAGTTADAMKLPCVRELSGEAILTLVQASGIIFLLTGSA